jgi:hypothetical protein
MFIFLKVSELVWDSLFNRFWRVWGGLGRPLETIFGRLWETWGTLWAPGGVTLGNFGNPWEHFGSLEAHFEHFGGPPAGISPYGDHFVCDLEDGQHWSNNRAPDTHWDPQDDLKY